MATVVERRARLHPRPESARTARQAVRSALREAGRPDLADSVELLVSELVTNAVVHARTPIDLLVAAGPDGVRVTVRDRSHHLPSVRDYGRSATTGRGLQLVSLMADRHGTVQDPDGKVVWFEVGAPPGPVTVPGAADVPRPTELPVEVRLLDAPVTLLLAWRQHVDALLREHLLARWEDSVPGAQPVPEGRAYDAFAVVADALIPLRAGAGATARADISLSVRPSDGPHFAALSDLIDEVVASAEVGQMLAPPTQPEVRLLRRWVCGQVLSQLAGEAPQPWPGLPAELERPVGVGPEWDVVHVRESPLAVLAGDDLNRIVAASRAALALLGWDESLVGRRIGTVVPPRLREAHVAGFTRHLLTGETVLIGSEVIVPALRRDGSEIAVTMLVERALSHDGRPVFTATLRPAPPPVTTHPLSQPG